MYKSECYRFKSKFQPIKQTKLNSKQSQIRISLSLFDLIKENAFSFSININEKFRLWYRKYYLCNQILKILEKKYHAVLVKIDNIIYMFDWIHNMAKKNVRYWFLSGKIEKENCQTNLNKKFKRKPEKRPITKKTTSQPEGWRTIAKLHFKNVHSHSYTSKIHKRKHAIWMIDFFVDFIRITEEWNNNHQESIMRIIHVYL